MFFVQAVFSFTGWFRATKRCCLQILTFKESLAVWRSISFLGHFLMIALILVSIVLPPKSPRRNKPLVPGDQSQQKPESQPFSAQHSTAPAAAMSKESDLD